MKLAIKRILTYIIDMAIVLIISSLINIALPNKYDIEIKNLNQRLLEEKINYDDYFDNYKHLIHEHDKQDLGFNIITTIILFSYFVIIPYYKGQTIGQKILKIKMIPLDDDEFLFDDLIGRSIILNGTGYMLFMFIILYITNDNLYFILTNLFAFLQIIVVIISAFMVLYSHKHLSIADKFTNTRIEEIK